MVRVKLIVGLRAKIRVMDIDKVRFQLNVRRSLRIRLKLRVKLWLSLRVRHMVKDSVRFRESLWV